MDVRRLGERRNPSARASIEGRCHVSWAPSKWNGGKGDRGERGTSPRKSVRSGRANRQAQRCQASMTAGAPWFVLVAGVNGAGKSTFAQNPHSIKTLCGLTGIAAVTPSTTGPMTRWRVPKFLVYRRAQWPGRHCMRLPMGCQRGGTHTHPGRGASQRPGDHSYCRPSQIQSPGTHTYP